MQQLDTKLFYFVNKTLTNPVFDNTMPYLTDLHKSFLAVGLLTALALGWIYFRRREAISTLLLGVIAVAATDIVATYMVKPIFQRRRPPAAIPEVALRTPVHYGYSFPSNHSANSFALATVLAYAAPPLAIPVFAVATLISFSRVYVGVHFPFDVLGGALLGFAIGWAVWRWGNRRLWFRQRI